MTMQRTTEFPADAAETRGPWPKSTESGRCSKLALLVTALVVVAYALAPGWAGEMIYLFAGCASLAGVVVGRRSFRPSRSRPWIVVAAALGAMVATDVIWTASAALDFAIPFPSVGDVVYFSGYLMMVVAILSLIAPGHRRALTSMIDASTVARGVGMLSWVFLVAPLIAGYGEARSTQSAFVIYSALDLTLLAAAVHATFATIARFICSSWRSSYSSLPTLSTHGACCTTAIPMGLR